MSTMLVRVTAGGVLAIIAPAVLAGAGVDGLSTVDSTTTAVESSCPQEAHSTVMEEVVVYGTAAVPQIDNEQLKANLREQARMLNERLKASIEKELKRLATPKVELADSGDERLAVRLPPA